IDILDGVFAPNKTFLDQAPFLEYAKDLRLEVHMMVDNPAQYIEKWVSAGFTRFIGQIEKMPDIVEFVAKAEEVGEVGLAVDSDTPSDKLNEYLDDLDFAFVMTVKAGFSNQSFLPDMLKKVEELRIAHEWIPIEVDGGINSENIVKAKNAGATRFVSTGFIFNQGENPQKQFETLQALVR
ncbi:MAG: hypothetical protein KGJ07_09555, partial [Patescibacteria group bacterium]|nr:hypothetical protein [Patescibacteria group bacterium]